MIDSNELESKIGEIQNELADKSKQDEKHERYLARKAKRKLKQAKIHSEHIAANMDILKEKIDFRKQFIFVVNCHLQGNPIRSDLRFAQMKSILSKLESRIIDLHLCKDRCKDKKAKARIIV